MKIHKQKTKEEYEEYEEIAGSDDPSWYMPWDYDQWWGTRKTEVQK